MPFPCFDLLTFHAHRLHDKEGVAFRLLVQPICCNRIEGMSGKLSGQGGSLGSRESLQGELDELSFVTQRGQPGVQGMRVGQFFSTQSTHDEQASSRIEAQQVVQPCEGLLVTPLQIVQEQQ